MVHDIVQNLRWFASDKIGITMNFRHRYGSAVIVGGSALLCAWASMAGNLSFLDRTVAAKLSREDYQLQSETAQQLLADGAVGQQRAWSNPNTSASGTIRVVKIFTSTEGFACKTLRAKSVAGGRRGQITVPVCEVKPGDWTIHADAKPGT